MKTIIFSRNKNISVTIFSLIVLLSILSFCLNLDTAIAQSNDESKVKNRKTEDKFNFPVEPGIFLTDAQTILVCGGNGDNFTCPIESTERDADLVNMLTTRYATSTCFGFLNFDDIPWRTAGCTAAPVGFFVHKLSFTNGGISSATLVIKCKAASKNQTSSDYIAFFEGSTLITGCMLKDLAGGTWNHNQEATFNLNLSNLPSGFDKNNILPYIQDGDLDVLIGTETGVDNMCLTVQRRWMDIGISFEALGFNPDTLRAYIRGPLSPYPFVDSGKAYPITTGSHLSARLSLANALQGNSYYIVIKHRNSIETWSANPVTITGDSTVYDFTTSLSQAYGNNMILVGGVASIYSGDVNQDGVIDIADISLIDNDGYNYVSGYVVTDLNGDGIVDGSDAAIVDNNAYNFIYAITPAVPNPSMIRTHKRVNNNYDQKLNDINKNNIDLKKENEIKNNHISKNKKIK